jgi:hypothetical protein
MINKIGLTEVDRLMIAIEDIINQDTNMFEVFSEVADKTKKIKDAKENDRTLDIKVIYKNYRENRIETYEKRLKPAAAFGYDSRDMENN